jgi:hypothetical protein
VSDFRELGGYLGQYNDLEAIHSFSGNSPTPVALGLWYSLLKQFSNVVAEQTCKTEEASRHDAVLTIRSLSGSIQLTTKAAAIFTAVCGISSLTPMDLRQKAITDLWRLLALRSEPIADETGGMALPNEEEAFVKFAMSLPLQQSLNSQVKGMYLQDLMLIALFNPHIVLEI